MQVFLQFAKPSNTAIFRKGAAMSGRQRSRRNWASLLLACLLLLEGSYGFHSTGELAVAGSRRKTCLAGMWSQDDEVQGTDRIKACVPYLLPLMDGDQFGHYIYERFPVMGLVDDFTIGPLADLSRNIPFLSLGFFVALTLGTRSTEMSRNLRFSAQQAALIDVALIVPILIGSCFEEDPLPRYLMEPCSNFVWYAYMTAVIYSVFSNLRGKKPDQIPYLSDYSEMMVGPF